MLLFQGDKEKKILAFSILVFVRRFVWDVFDSLFAFTEILFLHVINKEPQPAPDVDTVYSYVMICAIYGTGIWIIRRLSKYCVRIFEDKMNKWYIIIAVPLFVLVLLSEITVWGAEQGIMVRSGGDWGLYYDQLFSYGGNFIFSVLVVLAAGFYVFGMHRIYLEQKKKEYYHAQIVSYRMLEEQYRNMERVRHDFRNHVIALQGFLEKNDYEKMKDYFRQMIKAADIKKGEEVTGNTAIEACERIPDKEMRFLMMYAKTVKKCFLIEIRNSTNMCDIRER